MLSNWKRHLCLLTPALPLLHAASLQQITTNFGDNPTKVGFYIYVPDKLAASPPILVDPHWCHGSAQSAYSGSQFATLANKHGFIVIYPNSPNSADMCWDVSSSQTLTHDAGGDSLGIVSMVRWTIKQYKADSSRVFVTGVSSGAMMTNVLVGSYPDVFAGGSAFAGVPFGCFAPKGSNAGVYDYWSDDCAKGKVTHTQAEWAAIVKSAYPGYAGWRPKMQVFHGTADETLNYVNFGEEIKMWTGVFGLSSAPSGTTSNTPVSGWTKTVYGSNGWFEAYSAAGVSHNIQVQEANVVAFFQLNCTANCFSWGQGGPTGGSSSSTIKSTATPTSSSSVLASFTLTTKLATASASTSASGTAGIALYGQCGGIGYTGVTQCAQGACTAYNSYYSQCVPA
ncbi:alpha/beta-hydrolase [Coniochaeta ligniaria NRRL 30616]|uniref:Carboxylic ester hydrolase n=1 Tax=Coniochaeta ligniaria NRRL 30616 TaxID=1408157 RepID=A0A1J7IAV5_9PEZI|nr:alpha/beta-hydrolase [Coniochaeta ligniaria NRRL 30616]